MTTLKAATDMLRATLAAAQTERDQRLGLVDGPDGPECEWAAYERTRMHEAVNAIRAERGLSPIPVDGIIRADRLAAGHSDYSLKFAFYCAELAAQEELAREAADSVSSGLADLFLRLGPPPAINRDEE